MVLTVQSEPPFHMEKQEGEKKEWGSVFSLANLEYKHAKSGHFLRNALYGK